MINQILGLMASLGIAAGMTWLVAHWRAGGHAPLELPHGSFWLAIAAGVATGASYWYWPQAPGEHSLELAAFIDAQVSTLEAVLTAATAGVWGFIVVMVTVCALDRWPPGWWR